MRKKQDPNPALETLFSHDPFVLSDSEKKEMFNKAFQAEMQLGVRQT